MEKCINHADHIANKAASILKNLIVPVLVAPKVVFVQRTLCLMTKETAYRNRNAHAKRMVLSIRMGRHSSNKIVKSGKLRANSIGAILS